MEDAISKVTLEMLDRQHYIKYINSDNESTFMVMGDNFYHLVDRGDHFAIAEMQAFINEAQYLELNEDYRNTMADLKANRDIYEKSDISEILGQLQYMARLINRSLNQLTNLGIL